MQLKLQKLYCVLYSTMFIIHIIVRYISHNNIHITSKGKLIQLINNLRYTTIIVFFAVDGYGACQ